MSTIQTSLSVLNYVNSTTQEWRVDPLPWSNITVLNGTLTNGTIINGYRFNGTAFNTTALNTTAIIERVQGTTVGSLSLVSFIYMIMSLLIILIMVPDLIDLTRALTGRIHRYAPAVAASTFSDRDLKKQLLRHYPPAPTMPPLPSYLEAVSQKPGETASAQNLRECRELIRAKYALDVEAYSLRDVHYLNQPIVEDKKRRSRGALEDIRRTVDQWKDAKDQWSPDEWKQVEEIHRRIQSLVNPRPGPRQPFDAVELP
ncbi:hypothetical protein K432DRAFT_424720 [Lepidopterella palustris CBS 459.81]|uniref:Uncharacterized protein n=1 Tax=Lepidopterella palustris CBS 459.81 TaxID=1314670 RepID=A0A8E2JGI7_9PEZI|nr:hypothetical protein K432DRAFT_424720 [Lepidopterella palustris CBS 459.81]